MAAHFEQRNPGSGARVWVGKYRKLHNLPHWHMEHELIACRGGSALLMLEGHQLTIPDGFAAFCPSGCVHHIDSDEDATLIVSQVDTDTVRFWDQLQLASPVFPDTYGIFTGMEEILQEQRDCLPLWQLRAQAILVQRMIDVLRGEETIPYAVSTGTAIAQYRELLTAIEAESEFITFPDAAARMNMSPAYFSRYFKHATGMTFSDYLNLIKVSKAVSILKNQPEISTASLALQCGFNTLRSFNRVFRKITGFAPRQLPPDFSLPVRRYTTGQSPFDPTLEGSVEL